MTLLDTSNQLGIVHGHAPMLNFLKVHPFMYLILLDAWALDTCMSE